MTVSPLVRVVRNLTRRLRLRLDGDQNSVTVYDGTGNTVSNTYVTTTLYDAVGEVCAILSADGYAAAIVSLGRVPTTGAAYETVDKTLTCSACPVVDLADERARAARRRPPTTPTATSSPNEDPSSDTTTSTYSPDDLLCWTEPLSVSSPSCASPPTGTGTQTTT